MRKVMAAALTGFALIGLVGTASAQQDVTPIHKTKAELQKQADEFTAHQLQTYPEILPGARFITPRPWGGLRDGVLEDGQQYMANMVEFKKPGAEQWEWSSLITQVNAPGLFDSSPEEFCEEERTCTGTVSDNQGGVIVFSEDDRYHDRVAHNFRPNGEVVFVQGSREEDPAVLAAIASDRAYTFTR